jgi:hypothetical protein
MSKEAAGLRERIEQLHEENCVQADMAVCHGQCDTRDSLLAAAQAALDAMAELEATRCRPVWGSCELSSGHAGQHDASSEVRARRIRSLDLASTGSEGT